MFIKLKNKTTTVIMTVTILLMVIGCSNDNPLSPASQNKNEISQKTGSFSYSASDPSVPSEGIVVEGVRATGAALGDTRAMVEAGYGDPDYVTGTNRSYCQYPVASGGDVGITYRGADGSEANNSPDDIVSSVSWFEAVSGWITTAGVNTTLADENPEAVIAAYPNARVNYTQWGGIYSIIDYEQGIAIYRPWILYSSGEVHVRMQIFNPSPTPPLPEKTTYVYTIDLTSNKVKGKRQIRAFIGVRNQAHFAAKKAEVFANWIYPDGSSHKVESITSLSGYAYFEIINAPRGNYTLTVEDVVLEDYRFDSDKSVLSASIKVK
jgi:hypothetical protein